jgi:hypothetical protein
MAAAAFLPRLRAGELQWGVGPQFWRHLEAVVICFATTLKCYWFYIQNKLAWDCRDSPRVTLTEFCAVSRKNGRFCPKGVRIPILSSPDKPWL